jgi:hypothetical protein
MKTTDITFQPPYSEETLTFLEETFLNPERKVQFGLQPERLHKHIDCSKECKYVSVAGNSIKEAISDLPKSIPPTYNTSIITICINSSNVPSVDDIHDLLKYTDEYIDKLNIVWNLSLRDDQKENYNINILYIKN